MMHPSDDLLNAYAEQTIDGADRGPVDAHLASCAACRQTVDDLRQILSATATLDLREPPARAWTRIERAIRLEGEAREAAENSRRPRRAGESDLEALPDARRASWIFGSSSLAWLAAAAALVVAVFVGVKYTPSAGRSDAVATRNVDSAIAGAVDSAQVEAELREAEAHYENAIKGLEQIANAEQNELDPNTAATLHKNLAVIDQAINESRMAVRSQPASEPAQQSLIENFKTKIGLLQDTVALINEMRKGNEAGAARIVSGLKDKGN
jgi:anti-sigma factor ChrR (cupin superfamily)